MRITTQRAIFTQAFGLALVLGLSAPGVAEEAPLTYMEPSDAITRIVDAPFTPQVSLSPDLVTALIIQIQGLPRIVELAEPELKLAGYRIKPTNFGPSRGWNAESLRLMAIQGGVERPVAGLPEDPRLGNFEWSPDGKRFLFTNTISEGIELWVGEVETAQARRLVGARLNLTRGRDPVWLSDGAHILVPLRPAGATEPPAEGTVPTGPTVQENLGKAAPARTYQDLLENAHDEKLFEYYFTAQLAEVDLGGKIRLLGKPGILVNFDPSPDGKYLLVETNHRPFSYTVPAGRFPRSTQIWDRDGNLVKQLADKPLQDEIPLAFGSTETGSREFAWRADAPATLCWAEAQDGGDAGAEFEVRDKVFVQKAPFTDQPTEIASLGQRYDEMIWGDGETAFATSWWWPTRNVRIWHVKPDSPDQPPVLVKEYSWQDRYNAPGEPLMRVNQWGREVLHQSKDGHAVFLIGDGASDEGDRPFLDRFDLDTKETTRLFRSEAPYYERPVEILGGAGPTLLTRREAPDDPPNYFIRDLEGGELKQVTSFPHPTPELIGVHKELVRFDRADGVTLTGTLYLPAGYDQETDGALPTLLWAYPNEFKSADAASQVTDSPYRFVRVGWWSPLVWLTQGYAVLDDPSMPIIGEGDEEPNDTYVEQLVASAQAAADFVAARGVSDPERLAIGGHSYGAFMTANLLAHSDIFAAGIARSGAYNRTLTPFGFQAEERTYWKAPDVYYTMSPFMHADKINEPLLMIHGEMDNNSGTFPIQSERMYDALKAHGATARLVMLPYESHGYRARESILHMFWESESWLDTYVKARVPEGELEGVPEVESSEFGKAPD